MPLLDIDAELEFDPNRYAEELLGDSDLPDEQKQIIRTALTSNQKISSKLKNSVALRSSAQRALDKARDVANEAENVKRANFDWIRDNKDVIERWKADQAGGGGQPNRKVELPSGDVVTRSELTKILDEIGGKFQKTLQQQDEAYVGLITDTMALATEYSSKFKEPLPYAELQKFALDNRMTLKQAYPLFVAPKESDLREREMKAKLDEAYERGKQDGLTQQSEPSRGGEGAEWVGPGTGALNDVLMGRKTQRVEGGDGKPIEGEEAFVRAWNKTRGFTQKEH